jgi:transcription initiation factor TFIIB
MLEYRAANYKKAKSEENTCDVWRKADGIVNNEREGTAVCQYCGSVKEYSVIDESSEWRSFGNDGSGKSDGGRSAGDRTGGNVNMNLDGLGLETTITGGGGGIEDSRMMKAANRFQSSHDRNIKQAMYNFRNYAEQLNLSRTCQELVKDIFADAEKKGKMKGKNFEAKIAAAIYMASKMCNRPKNLRELISVWRCKRRDVTKCYKMLSIGLPNQKIKTNMAEWVTTLWNRVEASALVEKASRALVEIVWEREMLTGRNPNTIAGACLYMIAVNTNEPLEYRTVAEAAGLAESTIRETYKRLYPYRKEIIPQWFITSKQI